MKNSDWDLDLRDGKNFEAKIRSIFAGEHTYEVKHDFRSQGTDNLAFEIVNNNGRDASGIAITKAHYWIHGIGQSPFDIRIWEVITLRKVVFDYLKNHPGERKSGGCIGYSQQGATNVCIPLAEIDGLLRAVDFELKKKIDKL